MFSTKKPQSFVIEDGTYDTIIEAITEKVNSNGKRYIEVACRVRDGQPHARALVYRKIWGAKTPTKDDVEVGGYLSWQVYELADAAGVPEGKQFSTLDDLLREVEGNPVLATVKNQEYDGKSYPGVIRLEPSETLLSSDELRAISTVIEQNRKAREYANAQKPATMPVQPQQAARATQPQRYETAAYTPSTRPHAAPAASAFVPMESDDEKVPF